MVENGTSIVAYSQHMLKVILSRESQPKSKTVLKVVGT